MKTIVTLDKANQPYGFPQLNESGSLQATGSLHGTSSWAVSASWAPTQNIDTTSLVTTSSFNAFTGSYNTGSFTGSFTGSLFGTSSFASTASFAPNYLPLTGGTIDGNVTVNGTASIAFLNVTIESASVIYSSGSNQFGDATNDTQTLIGTVIVSGSQQITGSLNVTQGITGSLFGTSSWAINALTASYLEGYISPFPFTGSAQITGSLGVTGSIGIRYNTPSPNGITITGHYPTLRLVNSGSAATSAGGVIIVQDNNFATKVQGQGVMFIGVGDSTETNKGNITWTKDSNQSTNTAFNYNSFNDTAVYISGSGNVGIKTTTPNSASLHVSGNVFASSYTGSLFGTSSFAVSSSRTISASWAPLNAGGSNTQIQFNSGSALRGTGSFTFNYQSQSLQQGLNVTASGLYSHAEGSQTIASGYGSHAEGGITTASGDWSHAEGLQTQASGPYSHAEGNNTQAVGTYSHAEGNQTQALATFSHAEGYLTLASGNYSHAEGQNTQTLGQSSHAEGLESITGTNTAFTIKSDAIVNGAITLENDQTNKFTPGGYLYVLDTSTDTKTTYLISTVTFDGTFTTIQLVDTTVNIYGASFGDVTYLKNNGTFGGDAPLRGNYSHAEGVNTQAIGDWSHAEGRYTNTLGNYSHAEGYDTLTQGDYSHAEGLQTYTQGLYSHAEGIETQAIGTGSHAEGYTTKTGITTAFTTTPDGGVDSGLVRIDSTYGDVTAYFTPGNYLYLYDSEFSNSYGYASFLIDTVYWNDPENTFIQLVDTSVNTNIAYVGDLTYLKNNGTFGGNRTIPGDYSHAEGFQTQAMGYSSHAEGFQTQASGEYSHAEGNGAVTLGDYSHAEGNQTQAIGVGSHAEGNITKAIGEYSHAEGDNTQAKGNYSHAEGQETISSGSYSHAEGYLTLATGNYSHAEGSSTQAIGEASHAEGLGTVASGSYQHAQGQYNISSSDQSAFIIGNGTDVDNRSNLVFAAGNTVQITGSLNVSGSITGSLFGTASFAVSSSRAVSSSFAISASWAPSQTIDTSSLVTTSSFNAFTSSYNTGSFTGSFNGVFTGSLFGTASWATNAITATNALNGGVTQLLAGANITLGPTNGLGQVTISSTGGGGSSFNTATGSYGSFYSTSSQTNPVANIPRSMSLDNTDITNGVSISGSSNPFNTYIKTVNAGVYNIQFSAQVEKTDSGTDEIVIWLRKNGIDLTDTATTITLTNNNTKTVAAWNWFVNSAANDYYQIIWISADTGMRLLAETISGTHPGIPSVIVTVNRVDQFLSNTGSFSGSFTGAFSGSGANLNSIPASAITGLNLSQIATGSVTASVSPTQFTVSSASIAEFTVTGTGVTLGSVITDTHRVTGSLNVSGAIGIVGNLTQGLAVTASGLYSHAQGELIIASGDYSHAEGNYTTASGNWSHAEGYNTQATGSAAHAEGASTRAFGSSAHAEGVLTLASGPAAHAEGSNTQATAQASHAEGNQAIASGLYSHAEGEQTRAIGQSSHAEGFWTVASGSYQHVQGQYNMSSSAQSAFIIGNGTSNANRSNLVFASGSQFQITGSLTSTATTLLNTLSGNTAIGLSTDTSTARLQVRGTGATSATNTLLLQNSSLTNLLTVRDDGSSTLIGRLNITPTASTTSSLVVTGPTVMSGSSNTVSGSVLTVVGSGSAQPVFTVQGSQGELFSVVDSLSGSLFSVNDISGLPIVEVFSDGTTLIGNYLDPMLITTTRNVLTNSGSFTVYSLPTASYDAAFFDYSVRSGSNARAGQIMAIQSASVVNYTEVTSSAFGTTTDLVLGVFISGSNMVLTGSAATTAWTIKTIIRSL